MRAASRERIFASRRSLTARLLKLSRSVHAAWRDWSLFAVTNVRNATNSGMAAKAVAFSASASSRTSSKAGPAAADAAHARASAVAAATVSYTHLTLPTKA